MQITPCKGCTTFSAYSKLTPQSPTVLPRKQPNNAHSEMFNEHLLSVKLCLEVEDVDKTNVLTSMAFIDKRLQQSSEYHSGSTVMLWQHKATIDTHQITKIPIRLQRSRKLFEEEINGFFKADQGLAGAIVKRKHGIAVTQGSMRFYSKDLQKQ